jgi:DtxR family transcriptional regulator, Mn-dependent transcriptional regulator
MKAMRRETPSVSQEDYLKAIWEIVQEEQVPISARLAEDLGVTPPAVTAALKRMARAGHLRVRCDGRIELTAKGKGTAQHLVLRHRLAEKLLTEIIGLEWSRAHEEAERLEHGISAEVVRLLLVRFGRDSRCPHGVPLFGGMSRLRRKYGAVRLSEVPVGRFYEVLRVYEKDPVFLKFLEQRNLRPSARVRVLGREYDQTMSLTVSGHGAARIHLGKPATERVWVRQLA